MPPLPSGVTPPPLVPWSVWDARWARTGKPRADKGSHVLFVGPTQSGKTLLARLLARHRSFVVVFGTKKVDESLDEYIDEGYTRIEQWPPTDKQWKEGGWSNKEARFILWPQIKTMADLTAPKVREQYAKCLADMYVNGGWTLVADEGLWLSDPKGLNLGNQLAAIAYASASNGVSMYLLVQRPSGLPRVTWSSVSDVMVFHLGVTNDVRELASLGTYPPRDATVVIQSLRGHQFLALPCRGGAEWSISEVDRSVAG